MYIIFIIQKQHKTTVFVSVTSQKNHPLRRHRGQGSLGLQPGTIEVRRHGNTYRTYVSFCDIVIYYDMIYIYIMIVYINVIVMYDIIVLYFIILCRWVTLYCHCTWSNRHSLPLCLHYLMIGSLPSPKKNKLDRISYHREHPRKWSFKASITFSRF